MTLPRRLLDFETLPGREQSLLLDLLVRHSRDHAVFEIDSAGTIVGVTESFSRVFGYPLEECLGLSLTSFYPAAERTPERMTNLISSALASGQSEEEGSYQRRNNQVFSARTVLLNVTEASPPRFMVVVRDQTLLVASHDQLRALLTLDGLTELNNRHHVFEIGRIEYRRWQRYHVPLSMVVCELGGIQIDEDIQRDMADILRQSVREVDVAARLEEGLFCTLMFSTPLEGACVVAERIRRGIDKAKLRNGAGQHPAVNLIVVGASDSGANFNSFYGHAAVALNALRGKAGDHLIVL